MAALSPRGVTRTANPRARRLESRPTKMAVAASVFAYGPTGFVGASGLPIVAGAPGIPTDGPLLRTADRRGTDDWGAAGVPAISRADARLRTGVLCRRCVRTAHRTHEPSRPRLAEASARLQERQDRACRHCDHGQYASGHQRKRLCALRVVQHATSPRTSACSIRRTRKRCPLSCCLVVGCRTIPSPSASLRRAGGRQCH